MTSDYLQFFRNPKSITLLLLGFASGLPLALTSGTLQAWITLENVDLKTIGLFSLVGQPYVFKFLWSPFLDRYTPPWLGRRRGWLLLSQISLFLTIGTMGFLHPAQDLHFMALLAILIAFCSATQDVVFDAWKIDVLPASERGTGVAISTFGYRIALLVSSGLALWLAGSWLGWQRTYWLMALLLIPCIITTFFAREPQQLAAPASLKLAVMVPLRDFFSRNNAWLLLLLIIGYKLGDAFALSLSTTFLLRGVGFNLEQLALVNKTLGLFATLAGTLAGGILMQRMSLFRALLLFGILQGVSNLGYWLLAVTDKHLISMATAVFVENLCGGMGSVAFVVLLMTLCNKSFSATQFALLSALSAIGRVYVGPAAGWFVEAQGWPLFYLFSIVAALPGLLLLLICRRSLEHSWQQQGFIPRLHFSQAYRLVVRLIQLAAALLGLWLLVIISNALHLSAFSGSSILLQSVIALIFVAMLLGGTLDYLALRKTTHSAR